MDNIIRYSDEYGEWLRSIKVRIRQTQLKAALSVNGELLQLYWELGAEIVEKQEKAQWGDALISQMSRDLQSEFPDGQGFSERNLKYCRQVYSFYNQQDIIGQQLVAQLPEGSNPLVQQLVALMPKGLAPIGQQAVAQLPESSNPILQQFVAKIPWGHNILLVTKYFPKTS
jgi:predicted nuclease of restriction endonuclease-like (RecB) superfamily